MISVTKTEKMKNYQSHWQLGRHWLYTAKMLKTAADKIRIDYQAAYQRFPVIREGIIFDDPDLDLYCPYMLLMGYALENIFKGIIICESGINDPNFKNEDHLNKFTVNFIDNKKNPTSNLIEHDLLRLLNAEVINKWCTETFNDPEKKVMDLLHNAVIWSGRYPSPKKYDPSGDDSEQPNKARTKDDSLSFHCLEPIDTPSETVEIIYDKAMQKLIELCKRQEAKLREDA